MQTLTEKLMTYALGRSVEHYDMPTVRQIVRDAARDNYRFSSLVMGIVKSAPFQMRKVPDADYPRRPQHRRPETDMFPTKTSIPSKFLAAQVSRRTPVPRRDGPGLDGAGADGAPEAAHGIHVSAARRDHGALDAGAEGKGFELTPILKPFEPFKKQLTIVSGLENKPAIAPPVHALNPAPG